VFDFASAAGGAKGVIEAKIKGLIDQATAARMEATRLEPKSWGACISGPKGMRCECIWRSKTNWGQAKAEQRGFAGMMRQYVPLRIKQNWTTDPEQWKVGSYHDVKPRDAKNVKMPGQALSLMWECETSVSAEVEASEATLAITASADTTIRTAVADLRFQIMDEEILGEFHLRLIVVCY